MDDISVIAALVEHKPGVLFKVSNLFRRRGFNIENITVGPIETSDLARMTITVKGDEATRDQVVKQLRKLIEVVHVEVLNPESLVQRELALIKVKVDSPETRREIMDYTSIFRGRVVDVSPESMIVEITGTPDKMDAFINLMLKYGIIEIARTGVTALTRGKASITTSYPLMLELGE